MSVSAMNYTPSYLFFNDSIPSDDGADSDVESDGYTEMSIDGFESSAASTRTSLDLSMRSPSPVQSVFSVTSSLRAQSYVHEYGRGLNNYSEVYRLPADEEELERLDKQYDMFNEILGKYPPPVAEIIVDDIPGETKAILDLGCGSGRWIIEMAREFPHCSAVAVDLVPMQAVVMPPNMRCEVDDINLGLEHFYGDFNFVHAMLICSGIRDYEGLIDQISHALRPGGLVDLIEFPFRFASIEKKSYVFPPGAYEPPWAPLWMHLANEAVRKRGGDADASNHLFEWVSEHPAYEDIVHREYWIPCHPWMQGDDAATVRTNRLGAVMRDDILSFLKSGRPLLLGSGLTEAFVDDLEAKASAELIESRTPYYVQVTQVYARRNNFQHPPNQS